MVVPVLITSCQLSEKWKRGPVAAHASTTAVAIRNARCVPTAAATR